MFDQLKKLFIQEVSELLAKAEKDLLLLENDKTNIEVLQDISRTMHTIKGSAGIYNLKNTILISHNFENLFVKIMEGEISATNEIISLALDAKDILLRLIEADTESEIPSNEIETLMNAIDKIKENNNKSNKNNNYTNNLSSFYILFEPNKDIKERGIKIDTILSDFNEFEFKIVEKLTNQDRRLKNKHENFYEIIVASEYLIDELNAIFLFVPEEFSIKKICSFNIFESPDFNDFYINAVKIIPDLNQHFDLILNFSKAIENQHINIKEADKTTEKEELLIGADEIILNVKKEIKNLQYIKVPADKLDELLNQVSELIISNSQLSESTQTKNIEKIKFLSEKISKITNSIKENTLNLRLVPIKNTLPHLRRVIRDLSIKLNKEVTFIEDGVETQVDKTIIDSLYSPLLHVIRNAIDHGIEEPEIRKEKGKNPKGIIRFIAYHSNAKVIVQIQDDGKGIDPEMVRNVAIKKGFINKTDKLTRKEIYELLFLHGFTTTDSITDVSGRGVGMDAIKKVIQDLRGDIEIDSEVELGTSVTIKLPLTLSIIEALHVASNSMHFLIPVTNIEKCVKIKHSELNFYSGTRIIIDGELIPYINIKELFKIKGARKDEENLVIVNQGRQKVGLIFSDIFGEYQAVIKNMGSIFNELDFFIGASILGNGSIAYIIDSYKLLKRIKSKK
ncbi:MAG: chemotaxis protein CheA [Bacteroidales bacterium]|nr:chemotaxis protein CheA [Bacteroidales bacterium]